MQIDNIRENLAVLGFGNMGQAIVKGLLQKGIFKPNQIFVFDPAEDKKKDAENLNVQIVDHSEELLENAQTLLIAVKPQIIQTALQALASKIDQQVLIISIAAGISINYYKNLLNRQNLRIVRTMPNAPALVGEGITGISLSSECTEQDRHWVRRIFQSIGEMVFVPEEQIDVITAISGSGPAYFYYLCEGMIESGKSLGLSDEIALSLVRQTLYGSGALLVKEGKLPQELRARVTSKGGTTEAAIQTMEARNLKSIVNEAINSAFQRSKELGK